MGNVHRLRPAPPLTPLEEIRAEVIKKLEQTLAEAKNGEIDEIVIMAKCAAKPDEDSEEWIERATPTLNFRAWIGALGILQADWVDHYREHRQNCY